MKRRKTPGGPRSRSIAAIAAVAVFGALSCMHDEGAAMHAAGDDAPDGGLIAADAAGEGSSPDALDDDAPWDAHVELCANGIDDDGDGLVDEDCAPSLFFGWFPPGGSDDLALGAGSHVAKVEGDLGRKLSVIQTYRSTSPLGAARAKAELEKIWSHGAIAHLYFEPATDGTSDLTASAKAVVSALAANPSGRLLLSFGAEMNGNWTAWGCKSNTVASYLALSRAMHDAVSAALAAAPAVDPRRLRWVYAPNSTSSAGCGSAADYYAGADTVDLLGMSAYRSGDESVDSAVVTHAKQLMNDLAYPPEWQRGRFVVLQTGSRTAYGDRGVWLDSLVKTLAADPAFVGVIPFDLSDADPDRDWALLDRAMPPAPRSGYDAFVAAAEGVAVSDARLEGIFDPYFWDVSRDDAAYPEIQALRAAGVTSGCRAAPPLFCPKDALSAVDAVTMLARTFSLTHEQAESRVGSMLTRASFAHAVVLSIQAGRPKATKDIARIEAEASVDPEGAVTRAEAARWLVHGARLAAAPIP